MNSTFFLSHPRQPTTELPIGEQERNRQIQMNIKEAHEIAEIKLKGINLVEPFVEIPQDGSVSEEEAMERCIRLLLSCDGIIMSGDWTRSVGCRLEFKIAKMTGKTILALKEEVYE